VREFKLKKWVAAGLIVSMPYAGVADAAGLGRMNVLSQLGQPFSAEIELVNVTKEELATLGVRLASPEAYRTANLQYNPALNGLRLVIDRRPDGRPFIRAISSRPVAEPFLDLLVEVAWQSGRIVREYTALLDPPGLETPAAAITAPVVQAAPATKAPAPAAVAPAAAPTAAPAQKSAPVAAVSAAPSRPITGSEYAVKPGDTLGQIAAGMRPEGISLDQMMIGLLRANPDAFINNNINLVRAGKILKAPERDQLAAVSTNDASQEVRVQAANWNAYRAKVADTAPTVADAAPATKGKITTRVEDKVAAAGPKDVVVLSKGDSAPAKGKDGKSGADRVRALEEDLASRDKALAESNERIAILEKTIKDMQKLAELKNPALAAAQQAGKGDAKVDTKIEAKPEVKAEPPKAEPAAKDAPKPPPKAPAKAAAPPPPPPTPGIMDTVMDNIVPIGGGVLLAGLAGLWAVRRKKTAEVAGDEPPVAKTEPFTGNVAGAGVAATGAAADVADALEDPIESNVADGVDPIEEAQVYIDHGRDNQAEDILKEAIAKDPQRQDVQLKLLEVYAARGDKDAFNTLAKDFNALTGGAGESWNKAVAMGHAIDPSNALYPSTGEIIDIGTADGVSTATVDLDIGAEDSSGTTTDILLDKGSDASAAAPESPKFDLDVPPASVENAPPAVDTAALDFNLDLPKLDDAPAAPATPAAKPADDGGLDFKVDFSGIDLNLDDKPAVGGGDKDAHWNDVQQKFDLARAYQEMGDKAGAKDILLEVVREGDAGQKSEAQKLLDSIK
jgi:pilus assembly protein FimV